MHNLNRAILLAATVAGMARAFEAGTKQRQVSGIRYGRDQLAETGDIIPAVQRLAIAREAVKESRFERAIAEFKSSIHTEPDSAADAITAMSKMLIQRAASSAQAGKPIERAHFLSLAMRLFNEIIKNDSERMFLTGEAQSTLFEQIAVVKGVCSQAGLEHIGTAERFLAEAKNSRREWYTLYLKYADDPEKQWAALHEINLAKYYAQFLDEKAKARLASLRQQLKDALPKSQYEEIMDNDRSELSK